MVQAQENYALGTHERLAAGIAAASDWLLDRQASDGHWCAELEGDTILESEFLIYLHFIGKLDLRTTRKAGNYVRSKLLPEKIHHSGGEPFLGYYQEDDRTIQGLTIDVLNLLLYGREFRCVCDYDGGSS